MAELTTYLFPAVQGLFCLIVAVVWLIGFIRQRNIGFLLLTLATLAEGVTSLVRQALINYVFFHESHLSAAEKVDCRWDDFLHDSWLLHSLLAGYRPRRDPGYLSSIEISNQLPDQFLLYLVRLMRQHKKVGGFAPLRNRQVGYS